MFLGELVQDVSSVRGVGPAMAARLARLGVSTVCDLLLLLPRSYEDRSAIVPLAQAAKIEKACVAATVVSVADLGWGRTRTLKAIVSDGSTEASLLCFGRPFLRTHLQPGSRFFLWGSFRLRRGELQCSDFELEPWSETPSVFGKILPVYPLTEGLTQASLRKLTARALAEVVPSLDPMLPSSLLQSRGLLELRTSLQGVHFPKNLAVAERCRAVPRLRGAPVVRNGGAPQETRAGDDASPKANPRRTAARFPAGASSLCPDRRSEGGRRRDRDRAGVVGSHGAPAPGRRRLRQDARRPALGASRRGGRRAGGVPCAHGAAGTPARGERRAASGAPGGADRVSRRLGHRRAARTAPGRAAGGRDRRAVRNARAFFRGRRLP